MKRQSGLATSERRRLRCALSSSGGRFPRWSAAVLLLGLTAVYPGVAGAVQADPRNVHGESSKPPTPPAAVGLATPRFMWEGRPPKVEAPGRETHFVVEAAARAKLQALWAESIGAAQERVACIAGYLKHGVYHVSGVEAVPTEMADSLHVSPGPSLERCGPPDWVGTVHTHIIPYRGQPYSTLSASDRAVTGLWRERYKTEGVFCVLYTSLEAYCEFGTALNGDAVYADESAAPASGQSRPDLMPRRRSNWP